jgi:hypothetical protein
VGVRDGVREGRGINVAHAVAKQKKKNTPQRTTERGGEGRAVSELRC